MFLTESDNAQHSPRRRYFSAAPLAIATLLVVAAGCGESWVEVFPTAGAIKVDGQPPVGAQLVLHATTPLPENASAPRASVKADGTFAVTTYQSGDGAPPGDYVITVQWYKIDKEGNVGPNVIPAEYSSPKTSPIKVTVGSGGPTTIEPINISLSGAKTTARGGVAVHR